jgi:hypothetical protein
MLSAFLLFVLDRLPNIGVVVVVTAIACILLVLGTLRFVNRLSLEADLRLTNWKLWIAKGIGYPLASVAVLGCKVIPKGLTTPTLSAWWTVCLFSIVLSWIFVTLSWTIVELLGRSSLREASKSLATLGCVLTAGLLWTGTWGQWLWALVVADLCLWGYLNFAIVRFPVVYQARDNVPKYASAVIKMNMGRFADAEIEIVQQLEKREDDYEGWMMLAKLYATRDLDLAAARDTVLELCKQENLTPEQVSTAFHKLADWYLEIGDDPESAREAMEEVSRRYPKLEVGQRALDRFRLIPATREEWVAYKERTNYLPRERW